MLQRVDLSELARLILEQTLADCSIERAMAQRVLLVEGEGNARVLAFGESIIDLAHFKRVRIVAVGKAAPAMLKAVLPLLPTPLHCDLAGIVISHLRPTDLPKTFKFFAGGHPVPNANSFAGARAVLAMLEDLPETAPNLRDTLCLFLISGGASAMMELPIDPAITLEDTVLYHRALVNCGATITEINCVRKHFSAVKGGRLAIAANRAECLSLLVSDVPVGHPEIVASGPTLPDISTADECRAILNRYSLFEHFPDSVRRFFASSELSETPKPESLTARAWILLDANDLAEAARQRAEQLGFHAVIDTTCGDLEYRAASAHLLDRLRVLRREHARVCLISVGEAAVSLPRISIDGGTADDRIGGRNQHLALYAATLFQTSDEPIAFLSAGSELAELESADDPDGASEPAILVWSARSRASRG